MRRLVFHFLIELFYVPSCTSRSTQVALLLILSCEFSMFSFPISILFSLGLCIFWEVAGQNSTYTVLEVAGQN